jgi:small-conductance mechanosensitive channel
MRNLLPNPYLLALGVCILSYMLIWGLKILFSTRVAKLVGNTKNKWDDLVVYTVEKTSHFFIFCTSAYIGYRFIQHSPEIDRYANRIFFVVVMWQIAIWAHHLLEKWISSTIRRRTKRNPAAASSISLIQLLSRMILFSVLFLFTLSNLGIKITTIIAGLGVGGIAVALALQRILGDLFSSLSIVLDKPFVVGDFIIIDQYLGEVEKIGLKTTRIRSLSGEQIIFSNSDLLAARIRNYKRMHERRISFQLHLSLHTDTEKLRTAVSIISAIIRTKKRVRFERCHFMKIANTSTDIETVYWVLSDDYDLYMDIQQDILIDIKDAFASEHIAFAYPTQTVQVLPTEIFMRHDHEFDKRANSSVDSIVS